MEQFTFAETKSLQCIKHYSVDEWEISFRWFLADKSKINVFWFFSGNLELCQSCTALRCDLKEIGRFFVAFWEETAAHD